MLLPSPFGRHNYSRKRCGRCHKHLQIEQFPKLLTGDRGFACSDCSPTELRAETYEYLTKKRCETPCIKCGDFLVYWYRPTDNRLCDVFKFSEQGYRLKYLQRLLGQLHPKCEACAGSPSIFTLSQQLTKQAAGYKGKAMKETNPETKAKLWRSFFRCVKRAKAAAEAEALNEQVEVEAKPEWETSRYGGLDEI